MSKLATNVVSIENSDVFIKSENFTPIRRNGSEDTESLTCFECNVDFVDRYSLNQHLLFHVKQPVVILTPLKNPPIKITLKSTSKDSFQVVSSPVTTPLTSPTHCTKLAEQEQEQHEGTTETDDDAQETEETNTAFSPHYVNDAESPTVNGENSNSSTMDQGEEELTTHEVEDEDYSNIPGAEPTPPPEPSPEYPKIRIKTTGLLRETVTITEITDDNPEGGPTQPEIIELGSKHDTVQGGSSGFGTSHCDDGNMWSTSSLEDPLRIPENSEKDDGSLLSLFSNNNDRAKDLGFTSSESEFISLDRLDDRNRTAMQVYNSNVVTPTSNQNPLDTLTGLPMQQLAQQVSRLQPNSGMHQQNVLINIQQFPQAPPPQGPTHGYQPPPMYHHPPQPTIYQPYQYQPPNPIYYPPAHGYPHHMPPPPPPQISQAPPQQQMPSQQQMQPPMQQQMQQQYRSTQMPQRQAAPAMRQQAPGVRPQMQRQPMPPRQGAAAALRQRAIAPRPRAPMTNIRGPRPRMPMPSGAQQAQNHQQRMVKRTAEQIQMLQKRKRVDVLLPDKNEDPDCQVVCMQPKNTGLPQIQSVQGATQDPSDGNVMHLSDSITLSVRNQPPKPNSPKKSDAKAVANILATRGITVTATAKAKEKTEISSKGSPPPPPVAINLNSAVSIIPAAKNGTTKPTTQHSDTKLPTVDLTDDSTSERHPPPPAKPAQQPIQRAPPRRGLPYRCDLCAAQYPTMAEVNKHKQAYHKTSGTCEVGVPLIDLKVPGVVQKLSSLGIFNYIPLPGAGSQGMFGIPVINARNAGNASVIGASSILTLGPIRTIPRTQPPNATSVNKTHPGAK